MLKIKKEELEKLYIDENKTITELAEIYGCKRQTMSIYLKKVGIEKISTADRVRNRLSKEIIYDLYITQNLTEMEICNKLNTSPGTLSRLIKEYDIRKDGVIYQSDKRKSNKELLTKEFLENEYKTKSINVISEETGISARVLSNKMKEYNIEFTDNTTAAKKGFLYRYGVTNTSKLDTVKEKLKQTNLEKYGVESYSQTDEFKSLMKQKTIEQMNLNSNRTQEQIDIVNNTDKFKEYILSLDMDNRTLSYLSNSLNYNIKHIGKQLIKYDLQQYCNISHSSSQYEIDIIAFIKTLGINNIIRNDREVLNGKEIDIYLPDYKFGIEFNGDYWHSDIFYEDHNGRTTKHQEKSLLAEVNGIFLYHIFEYEWINEKLQEKIKNHIRNILSKNTQQIYARKCEIKLVDSDMKKSFLESNHLQGNCPSNINIGLFYNDELVSIMCFTSHSSSKYTYELCRFCSLYGTNVVGGASKLFKYFINNYLNNNETVVSFSNITKTTGKMYSILNFKLDHISDPNYIWINLSSRDIKTRYQTKMKNEVETMHNNNYVRICDCGTKVWVYTKC